MSGPESDEGGNRRRRRPASDAYLQKVEAIRVVDPINERIGDWSPRVVYLAARAGHTRLTGTVQADILTEAKSILAGVHASRAELRERIRDLPAEIASHSRVEDAERALDALEASLAQTLMLLGPDETSR